MTCIKKLGTSYAVTTDYNTFMFDFNFDFHPFVDTIFISNSLVTDILYINIDVPIYITEPVYNQLLCKYEQEKKENTTKKISPLFLSNKVFIRYNQMLNFNQTDVLVLSSGLHFGWCMFKINNTFLYFRDLCMINKLCTKMSKVDNFEYILWSNITQDNKVTDIEKFNNCVSQNFTRTNETSVCEMQKDDIYIYVEFPNFLIDTILHINSYFDKPVKIESASIKNFLKRIKMDSDWINEKYKNVELKLDDSSNIILRGLQIEENQNYTVKITDSTTSYFYFDTKSSIIDIKKNLQGKLVELEDNVYWSLPENEYEDILVDGKIDLIDDTGYLFGYISNTDKNNCLRTLTVEDHNEVIRSLFEKEAYVCINEKYYFKRLGIVVYEEEGKYKIKVKRFIAQ